MESVYFINLIFIFVLNIFFFFSGVCLNSVVIISFWRSVQLRKKLCYFMIMVLSCCDLVAVITNTPLTAVAAMSWLTEKFDVSSKWFRTCQKFASSFFGFSLIALLVMNFDRYLATSYPLFHRTSVTKRRLLTLWAVLIIIEVTLKAMSTNDAIISYPTHILIIISLLTPPMLFINYKLFLVVKRNLRNNGIYPEKKKTFSLKNISSCLLAVACYVALMVLSLVHVGIAMHSSETTWSVDNAYLAEIWSETIASINATINCLIFYWKNKVLRSEGWKVLKGIKLWRGVQS